MFLESAPLLKEKINDAISKNDFLEIASQIHAFKTKFIMMGMNESKELALKIEMMCREEIVKDSVKEDVAILINQIQSGVNELKQS